LSAGVLFDRGVELPTLDQRLEPPQLAPHSGADAVRALCERQRLDGQLPPLDPTGRSRARLLPGVQGLD
jgi:hypothetical protein